MRSNLLVIQGGGPTSVVNASLAAIIHEQQLQAPAGRIYGARFGMQGLAQHELIDVTEMSGQALDHLRDSPGAALGSSRFAPAESDLKACLQVLRSRSINQIIFLGGNGTMAGAERFSIFCKSQNYDVQVMGAPKTIDNDIASTDRCPGYGSAARFVAQSTLDLGMDLASLPQPFSIFETLGRDVGWLAAASVLAKQGEVEAPHVICIPEVPFQLDRFLGAIDEAVRRVGWAMAVVSEGICHGDGTPVFQQVMPSGAHIPVRPLIGGVAQHLSGLVAQHLGVRCRSEKPGLIGRSSLAHVSPQDLQDAEATGRACVKAMAEGKSGFMASLLPLSLGEGRVELLPLEKAAGSRRTLPAEWLCDGAIPVSTGFCDYLAPIVGPLRRYAAPLSGRVVLPAALPD
ncbi:MAG: diphosphate--fructose-6-phosphate 1-phosphotransferase [Janthinobacterium lividum]